MQLTHIFALSGGGVPKNSLFSIAIVIFAITFVTNLVYLATFRKFSKYLHAHHPNEARAFDQAIGQSVSNPSRKNFKMIYRYFWSKQYQSISDATLNKYGGQTRVLLTICTTLVAILFITILGSSVIGNR